MSRLLTTTQAITRYGEPNQSGTYLVSVKLPYPMRLAWDTKTKVTTMRVHRNVAGQVQSIFTGILAHYGQKEIEKLGIDLFGGSFAYRPKRNGNTWSMHAFGIAIDLDPVGNPLRATSKTAKFAKPAYKPLLDIFYKHGWVNLGREANFDWMHFQASN